MAWDKFAAEVDKAVRFMWENFGVMPSTVLGETPHQLFALLFETKNRAGSHVAPLEVIRRTNQSREKKNLAPVSSILGVGITSVPDSEKRR